MLSASGMISGTPTQAGQFSFGVRVTDSSNPSQTASGSFTINVATQVIPLSIITASLPNGTVSSPYSTAVAATGGTTPYTWALASGALPTGLSLSPSGAISGTPTQEGQFSFSVRVADSSSHTATAPLSTTVSTSVSTTGYTSRTDLSAAPETIPALCSPAPCTMTSSDLNPNVTYLRVTDDSTDPYHPGESFATNGSAEQLEWNYNQTAFSVTGLSGGSGIIYSFDPSNQSVSRVPCNFSGAGCNSNTYGGLVSGVGWDVSWSANSAYVLYGAGSGTSIQKFDYTATVSNPATAATVSTLTASNGRTSIYSNCSGMSVSSGSAYAMVNNNDTRWMSVLGSSQDNWWVVYVFDITQGCRWYDISTQTTGGDWGPTGGITMYDDNSSIICQPGGATCPLFNSSNTNTQIHNARWSREGDWVTITVQNYGYLFFWQIATNNVYRCTTNTGLATCAGHKVNGANGSFFAFTGAANGTNTGFIDNHSLNSLPTTPLSTYSINPANADVPSCAWFVDGHLSAANAVPGQQNPVINSMFSTHAPTCAWVDEITGMAIDGSNTVWRFGHAYSRAHDFNAQIMANVSRDGKWAIFTSDWGGTTRDDVFLIPLK
jgi:Putative Ig domain